MKQGLALLALALAACAPTPQTPAAPTPPASSSMSDADIAAMMATWREPQEPFKLYANIHYVGTAGLSSFLITTPQGHILLDGGLPENAPMIEANIARLGFNIRDVRYLLSSHAHYDHAGGLAQLKRDSGAQMISSVADRPALEAGMVDYGPTAGHQFPPVAVDRTVGEGDRVTLGDTTLIAVMTPGHTKGCTSWRTERPGEDGIARSIFFHCSSTVAGASLVPPAYPGMVEDFRRTFTHVRDFSGDIFLAPHPEFFDMQRQHARLLEGDPHAFMDHRALQMFNDRMEEAFETELARQQVARR